MSNFIDNFIDGFIVVIGIIICLLSILVFTNIFQSWQRYTITNDDIKTANTMCGSSKLEVLSIDTDNNIHLKCEDGSKYIYKTGIK